MKVINFIYTYFATTMAMFTFLIPSPCSSQSQWKDWHFTGVAQGTTYHITYYAKDNIVTQKQIDSILNNIDSSLSIYKSYSLISQFNNSISGIKMDEHLRLVVTRSLEIYKATEGISDITIYPIVKAWGFGVDPVSNSPDSGYIKSILPCIGSDKIHIRNGWLIKDSSCIKLDVNGIAQGYSVDVIADFLEKKSIKNYLVEIGGELRIKGHKKPSKERMTVGIEGPAKNSFDKPVITKTMQFDKGAVTTSGVYRKYIQNGAKRFSHIMDPKTGYPVQNELISVTVWAKNAITADGYDNALLGMGLKKSLSFLKKHKEMEAYFIYSNSDGTISDIATEGFYKMIKSKINK